MMKSLMLSIKLSVCLVSVLLLCACQKGQRVSVAGEKMYEHYTQADYDYLAISNPAKVSAASKRALDRGYHLNDAWFG